MSDQPTYEVKIKDSAENPVIPTSVEPTLSEDKISALIDTTAQAKAEEIATTKVEKLKEELAQSLIGKSNSRYGDKGPESWEKFQDDTTERAVQIAEKKIEERLKAEREQRENEQKMSQKQIEEQQKAEYARISAEWQDAVADGILPDIAAPIKQKLQSGVDYSALTDEERKDAGLRAYNETRQAYMQMRQEGKTSSFYRVASQYYKQPAGTRAPVIGGGSSSIVSSSDNDFSYEEIAKNRKTKFGF